MKTGILLINLGTPAAPNTKAVRQYLKEFLSDERVIDIPAAARWLLVNAFILPFRPKQSAHAYQKIWQQEGSPLLLHSQNLKLSLQQHLGDEFFVALGMRYGSPSIESAIETLEKQKCMKVIVLPLFPQYASASTGSAIAKTLEIYEQKTNIPSIDIIHEFHQADFFIEPSFKKIFEQLTDFHYDHLIFSYHGLPERQIRKSHCDPSTCDMQAVCPTISEKNAFCYRAQCFATTKALAKKLSLDKKNYSTTFQSRLGRTPWIKPYTDEYLTELAKSGKKNIAIVCPSFTADCLETLEEIGLQAKAQWKALGGKDFKLIPCLNADPLFVKLLGIFLQQSNFKAKAN